jgi:hypothetical protein
MENNINKAIRILIILSLAIVADSFTHISRSRSGTELLVCHQGKRDENYFDAHDRRTFLSQVLAASALIVSAEIVDATDATPVIPKYDQAPSTKKQKLGGLAGKIRKIALVMVC